MDPCCTNCGCDADAVRVLADGVVDPICCLDVEAKEV